MHFPPKNRPTDSELGPIDIQIEGEDDRILIDPNTAIMMTVSGDLNAFLVDQKPVGSSDISGEPGVMYRTNEVQITLTAEEMLRLCSRALLPNEVQALLEKYGEFHEIHDDFYCHETFQALQPADDDAYEQSCRAWRNTP